MGCIRNSLRSCKFAYMFIMIPFIAGLINTIIPFPACAQQDPNSSAEKSPASEPLQDIFTLVDLPGYPGPGYLPTPNGEWVSEDAVASTQSSTGIAMLTISPTVGRKNFYLTILNYSGSEVLTACGTGYHTASFWEILNVTNLVYEYDNPAAKIKADSSYGPPSNWYGWIRTGEESSGANTAGTGNCLNWTSSLNTNYGTIVRLSNAWVTTPGDIFTWDAATWNCVGFAPVWCVRD
jgi:hypothetical protein